jgi:hypothetical protein
VFFEVGVDLGAQRLDLYFLYGLDIIYHMYNNNMSYKFNARVDMEAYPWQVKGI